jgi:putative SOS response-associated peptidase YedK
MPVVMGEGDWAAWLDPKLPTEEAKLMLNSCPSNWLAAHPVSRAVSLAKNDGPELIKALSET